MGKTAKRTIKYRNASLPENLGEVLSNADENDLKILVTLMMAADENGEVADDFSVEDALGIDKASVDASLKFWRGAGIIDPAEGESTSVAETEETVTSTPEPEKKPETKKKLQRSEELPNYTSKELSDILEKRSDTATLINECQNIMGKIFNVREINVLLFL